MKKPKVSIILATFNREDLIIESLKSIKDQVFQNWECLIIDDGSTDNTSEIVKAYIKDDNRFKYIYRSSQYLKGLPGCRNLGLDNAAGDYIIFFDDDDIVHPDNLNVCVEELQDVEVDYCRYIRETFTGPFYKSFENETSYESSFLTSDNLDEIIMGVIPLNSCQVMWKKYCFQGNKFNEELMYAEEWECYSRILATGVRGITVEKVLYFGRKHTESNTGEFWNNDPVRRDSKIKATKLVVSHLGNLQLFTSGLKRYFINLSIFLKEKSILDLVLTTVNASYFERLRYKLLFKYYPIIVIGHRIRKRIKRSVN